MTGHQGVGEDQARGLGWSAHIDATATAFPEKYW
jgi:hypothetical protein